MTTLVINVLIIVLAVGFAMRSFRSGRDLYAIGSNPEAAALAGIRPGGGFSSRSWSAALAGLAGALFLALLAFQVDVTAATATS